MAPIVTTPKSRKKQTAFEKLWTRATKLKQSNERLKLELEDIIARMRETVVPRETEVAKAQVPLMVKLLTLGQRKSMTNWERETLDDWIREMLDDLQLLGQLEPELLDHLACYDAFRMGIQLEDDSIAPHKQFVKIVREADEAAEQARQQQKEAYTKNREQRREQLIAEARQDIDRILNKTLGRRPQAAETRTVDMWEDELDEAVQQAQQDYDSERAKQYETLYKFALEAVERQLQIEASEWEDDNDMSEDEFDELFEEFISSAGAFNNEEEPITKNNNTRDPALTNDTFQQLFRATAAKLHPDREPSPELRMEKQKLMASLLKARKSGDLMTVLELYETWVGEHEGFSKADEKALKNTLQAWLDKLEEEKQELIMESPLHFRAHQQFHNPSKRKIEQAISDHLVDLKHSEEVISKITQHVTSLKTLKPWLEHRYEERRYSRFL